ncbi:MAG TPA: hypothetical protein VIC55_00980 [Gemmatimonadaceae bacterium]|jgi:hypothetical protein
MLRPALVSAIAAALTLAGTPGAPAVTNASAIIKWPPWLSIESPVNPFDRANHGAVLLVHAMMHDAVPTVGDLTATAEGIVSGQRRTVSLRLDTTSQAGVFALRRQWPTEGDWLLRITLARSTTALVTLDGSGDVASVRVPTRVSSDVALPRPVAAREIDSVLAVLASQRR